METLLATLLARGTELNIEETADLEMSAVAWNLAVVTPDFDVIQGEDARGSFTLIKGQFSGNSYLMRD